MVFRIPKPHVPRLLLYAAVFGLCSSPFFLPAALKAAWLGLAFAYGLRWLTPWQDGQGWDLQRVATERALMLGLKVGLVAAIPILAVDLVLWWLQPDWIGTPDVLGIVGSWGGSANPWIGALATPSYAMGCFWLYARLFQAPEKFGVPWWRYPVGGIIVVAVFATWIRLQLLFLGVVFGLEFPKNAIGSAFEKAAMWSLLPLVGSFYLAIGSALPFVIAWMLAIRFGDPIYGECRRATRFRTKPQAPELLPVRSRMVVSCAVAVAVLVGLSSVLTPQTLDDANDGGVDNYNFNCHVQCLHLRDCLKGNLELTRATPPDLETLATLGSSPEQKEMMDTGQWRERVLCPAVVRHHPKGEEPIPYLYLLRAVPADSIVQPERVVAAFDPWPVHGRGKSQRYQVCFVQGIEKLTPVELLQALDAMADPKVLKGCTRRTEGEKIVYDFTNGTTTWSLVYDQHRFRLYDATGKEISGE